MTAKADEDLYADLADMFGGKPTRKAQAPNFKLAPVDMMDTYGKGDVISAAELWHYQEEQIEAAELREIIEMETEVTHAITEMQHHGVRVDVDGAHLTVEELTLQIDEMRAQLDKDAGFPVNPNPSKSIHDLFQPEQISEKVWLTKCGTKIGSTPAGKASINAEALELIAVKNPIAKQVLDVRQLLKLRDTFVKGHVLGSHVGGRVYPRINQSPNEFGGTYTGRFSVTSPALQQIPVRNKALGPQIQKLFLPDEGQKMSVADFGQIDLRVCAHYTATPELYREYKRDPNLDMHTFVADIVGRERQFCKSISLGIPFGRSYGAIAVQLGLPAEPASFKAEDGHTVNYLKAGPEARQLLDRYVHRVPGVMDMLRDAKQMALTRGHIKTVAGRHLHFNKYTARKAAGVLYQSGAADLNKITVCRLQKFMKEVGGSLLVNVHDSYFVSLPEGNGDVLHEAKRLAEAHEDICRIPIRLDFQQLRDNWADAYKAPDYTDGQWSGSLDRLEDKWK